MGLDTSHNCWHGPYSSFNRFRKLLGEQIGIDIYEYNGFGYGNKDFKTVKHGIIPLINHSDCEGHLTVKQCIKVRDGLNDILENFKPSEEADDYFKAKIIQFRDGLIDAINKNQKVIFS